VSVPMSRL
jgi:ABC-type transport system, involved in lipoprotein release, permease component